MASSRCSFVQSLAFVYAVALCRKVIRCVVRVYECSVAISCVDCRGKVFVGGLIVY